jgi:hypothetical protein
MRALGLLEFSVGEQNLRISYVSHKKIGVENFCSENWTHTLRSNSADFNE